MLAPSVERRVARPKASDKDKSKRDDVAVKMDRTLIDKAKFVASRRRITLAEYLTELNRPAIERDFDRATKQMRGAEGAES